MESLTTDPLGILPLFYVYKYVFLVERGSCPILLKDEIFTS
jgi:hypothetical protein